MSQALARRPPAAPGQLRFATLFRADAMERIAAIKGGVTPDTVDQLAAALGQPKERLLATLGLPRATIDRKLREGKPLSPDEGSRVLGLARLVGQVEQMVTESGEPAGFDAARWLAQWLDAPLPALAGRKPAEFLDTADGQALVASLVARLQYASAA